MPRILDVLVKREGEIPAHQFQLTASIEIGN